MSKATMPTPAAWLRGDQLRKLGEPGSDSPINERADLMMLRAASTAETAKKYGHDVAVITTDQAEAYADVRVREALERAAGIIRANAEACDSGTRIMLRANAEAVLALLPSTPAKLAAKQ